MLVTLSGMMTLVRPAAIERAIADAGDAVAIVALVRLAQFVNASAPMLVTLPGIVTLVRLVQSLERKVPDAGDAVGDRDAGRLVQA